MPPEDDSALERLNARLYDPAARVPRAEPALSARRTDVPRGWNPPPAPPPVRPRAKLPLSVKFLIGAVAFFVVAGAVAAYFLFVGGRNVSTDNIIISVDGPTTAAGGDTVPLLITIENHNPVPISVTDFEVTFPDGTRSADDVTQPLTRYTDDLGDLAAGQAVTRTVRAVLFGSANQAITIPIHLEYTTSGSNAVFVKEKDYAITLTSSPITLTATAAQGVVSGQSLTFSISVRSNAAKPLAGIALAPQYPFGFAMSSSSIPLTNGLFSIGTLNPGQEKDLTVTGLLTGDNSSESVFHWSVGPAATSTNGALSVPYATAESDISITRPFLDVALSLNGNTSGAPTLAPGDTVQGTLTWTNTLSAPITNGIVTVALAGNAFDPTSVNAGGGFYQSSNATIRFDRDTSPGLATLAPGDTGTGTFSFQIKSAAALAALQSPSVGVSVSVSGARADQNGATTNLSSIVTRTMKTQSGFALSSSIAHATGPFPNTGSEPPVAGSPTSYAVILTAKNGANSIAGGSVTMTLPSYVTFTGATSPADGSVTYTDSTRTVKWAVGSLAANATKQASFQISFLPSASQKGTSPSLVSAQTFSGTDLFTQTAVSATAGALTSFPSGDPGATSAQGYVN